MNKVSSEAEKKFRIDKEIEYGIREGRERNLSKCKVNFQPKAQPEVTK